MSEEQMMFQGNGLFQHDYLAPSDAFKVEV